MRAMIFGTYDTAMHPRIATIAEGLAARGFEVTECNAPLGLSTADRVDMLAKPWKAVSLATRLMSRWSSLTLRALRMPAPDVVVVGYLGHFDVRLARLLFGPRLFGLRLVRLRRRRVPIVLDHLVGASDTAKDRRLDGGPRQLVLRMIDSGALRAADVIVVDTEEHLDALPAEHRPRAVVVPVGAPAVWNSAAAAAETGDAAAETRGGAAETPGAASAAPGADGPLRVVFYGLYTPLQGAPVIGAALGKLAGAPVEVTMIGSGQDAAATKAAAAGNKSVRWLDWVPAAELPAMVAAHDVCLGIFGTGAKALRVVPNKVFQGAAAGCAVVTSDTAPQRRMLGDAAVLVPPGDAGALADALLGLASDPPALAARRRAARELAERRFTPGQVIAPLVDRLGAARG